MANITSNQVSCVIPYAGASKYIQGAVSSCLAQGFREVLIVNDGFPPTQLDTVAAMPTVRILHLEMSVGCPNARNIGIKACNTPYVVLLDHDDVLCQDYLQEICAWMAKHQLRCAAATLRYIGESARSIGVLVGRGEDFVLPSGFISEIKLIAEVGYFPDSLSDDVLFFRAIRMTTKLTTCPGAHALYRIHPQAQSSSRVAKTWWAFNQLLPLYYQGISSLPEINIMAREFAHNGVIPPGMQSRFRDESSATVRFLSRSAYACWLNRDLVAMARYIIRLIQHMPELARLALRKWMPTVGKGLVGNSGRA